MKNKKEPEMMEKLSLGLNVLNSFDINYINGKSICFNCVMTISVNLRKKSLPHDDIV